MDTLHEDPLINLIEESNLGDYVKKHYKKLVQQGNFHRRGVEFAVKVLTQKPRKM